MRPICFPALPTRARKSGPSSRSAKKPMRSPRRENCCPHCLLGGEFAPLMPYTPTVSVFHLLRTKHAYPLFVVKGNEPTLQADLTTYFADPQAQFQQAETTDRRRGRVESRLIKVSQELCPYLQAEWP